MFKYLLVVLIFWYQIQGYAFASSDTILPLKSPDKHNYSENAEEVEKKFIVAMNGNNTYHVDQVIFYLNDRYKEMYNEKSKIYPDGYIVTPGIGVHKLHTNNLSWNGARHACIQEEGHLAVINSVSEEKILLHMLKDKNIDTAWLGLHDQFDENNWITINDVALENTGYTKWTGPHIPDNSGGNENCAILYHLGGMDDQKCDKKFSFVCEITA